jgi:stearoyl-CoA desaturase (delta-9 desaturase)
MDEMRAELATIWARSTAPADQLVAHLRAWCRRAESSGIVPLVEFSRSLRSYA